MVAATRLVPTGANAPIDVEDYEWSPDHSKLLIFTNSARVWRQNTRGDYLGARSRATGRLAQARRPDAPSRRRCMFAKFSPDGTRVGYVREHNLYVEDLADGARSPRSRSDGSDTTINGTFDWVYEEELDIRDGFRWSPGRQAHRLLAARRHPGVRDFLLIDNTDSLYSFVKPVQYPKAGTTNSAARDRRRERARADRPRG